MVEVPGDRLPKGMGSSLVFINADLAKSAQYTVALSFIALAIGCNSTYSQAADLPSGDPYAYVAPVAIVTFRVAIPRHALCVGAQRQRRCFGARSHRRHRFFAFGRYRLRQFRRGTRVACRFDGLRGGPQGRMGHLRRCRFWGSFIFRATRSPSVIPLPKLKVKARADAGLDYETTMAESGLTYEVARWGGPRIIDGL